MCKKYFTKKLIWDNIWSITGPTNDLMYLVIGKDRAMLVDTGMGIGNLKEFIGDITNLPIIVVNTHGHPDHAGGNSNFDKVFLCERDMDIMKEMCTEEYRISDIRKILGEENPLFIELSKAIIINKSYEIINLSIGQIIDIGGRSFEVLHIPGHTPGSICFLNSKEKVMFTGDSIIATDVWMYLPHSVSLKEYNKALKKIKEREQEFEVLFPGHYPIPVDNQELKDLISCSDEIILNPGIGEKRKTFAGEGLFYKHGKGKIIYNEENI